MSEADFGSRTAGRLATHGFCWFELSVSPRFGSVSVCLMVGVGNLASEHQTRRVLHLPVRCFHDLGDTAAAALPERSYGLAVCSVPSRAFTEKCFTFRTGQRRCPRTTWCRMFEAGVCVRSDAPVVAVPAYILYRTGPGGGPCAFFVLPAGDISRLVPHRGYSRPDEALPS